MALSRRKFLLGLGGLLTTGAVFDGFALEHWWTDYTFHRIGHLQDSHSTSVRCVQIADLHLRSLRWYHRSMCHKIAELKPDVLLFTGDQIDQNHRLPVLESFLKLLPREVPKIAILGNWEYFCRADIPAQRRLYKKYNGQLLINESTTLKLRGKSLQVTGLDDHLAGNPDLSKALKGHRPHKNHLLLSHCPQSIHTLNKQLKEPENQPFAPHVQVVLSGHTHGGQVNFFGRAPILPPGSGGYVMGWYDVSPLKMYVSRGLGTSILPIRFGSRSEIAVFDFSTV